MPFPLILADAPRVFPRFGDAPKFGEMSAPAPILVEGMTMTVMPSPADPIETARAMNAVLFELTALIDEGDEASRHDIMMRLASHNLSDAQV